MITQELLDKFNTKYKIDPETNCWNWIGGTRIKKWGYGGFKVKGFNWLAHRFSYYAYKGDPGKLLVCHKCDNPKCVNPEHLFLGTQKDNVDDMMSKDRHGSGGNSGSGLKGTDNPSVKLTEDNVLEIRRIGRIGTSGRGGRGGNTEELAKQFGVSKVSIANILHRRTWKHIK